MTSSSNLKTRTLSSPSLLGPTTSIMQQKLEVNLRTFFGEAIVFSERDLNVNQSMG